MDGWVTIGTKLDSKQLEKDIIKETRRLEKFEKDNEKLLEQKKKAELDLTDYYKQKELIEESTNNTLKKAQTEEQVNEVLKMEQQNLQSLDEAYSKELNSLNDINKKIEENAYQQGLVKDNIQKMNVELRKAKGFENIKDSVEGVGKSVQKVTKRITKMVFAVFGIRSAFMFVRSAINTIAGDDEQLKADIDYMKSALAYTLEPIVRAIVDLAKQLMFYVGYIVKAWTGKNIFANANKGLDKANKQAKELKKTTAGFDEMNILSDSGGTSGDGTPSFDLSNLDGKVPEWIDWIAKNGDLLQSILYGISFGLIAIKLGLTGIQALGIGIALAGIVYTFKKIIKFIQDPSFENFIGILEGIAVAVLGVAIAIGAWPVAIGAAIALALLIMAQFWDNIEKFLNDFINNIYKIGDDIMNYLQNNLGILGTILNVFIGTIIGVIAGVIDTAKNLFGTLFNFIKGIFDGILMIVKGDFKGGITKVLKSIGNLFIDVINTIISALNTVISPIRSLIVAIGKVTGKNWTMKNISIPKFPRLAKGGIVNMPSSGVPVGSAIAGERGQEGVIPLTDSQQMALLGEAIGKYITVDITNITQLDGRQIARKVDKINQNNNFVLNR